MRYLMLFLAASLAVACSDASDAPQSDDVPGAVTDDQSDDAWEPPAGDEVDDHSDKDTVPEPTTNTPPAPSTPATPAPACTPKTYRLRHLQASMLHTDTEARRGKAINAAFAADAETISWTEIETASQVRDIQRHAGWDTFWPSGKAEVAARNAVPVSWRSDTFTLVRGQSAFASDGLAGVSPSRFVTRVWLKHTASGKVVSRVAHHSVSGVDGAGQDPVKWRRARHAEDIAKFKEVMMRDTVPVIGSADFNTTRLRSLLGKEFAYDVPDNGGSHGDRLIDWIVRRPHPEHKFVDSRFIDLSPSDHRGVRSTYDYTPACP
jgi:hypothetical protein